MDGITDLMDMSLSKLRESDQVTEQRLCQEASGSKGGWAGGGPEVRAPEGTVLNRSLVKSLLL